jgi:hypothetical protein
MLPATSPPLVRPLSVRFFFLCESEAIYTLLCSNNLTNFVFYLS